MKKSFTGKLLAICLILLVPILYYATVSAKKPDNKAKMPKAATLLPVIKTKDKVNELISNVYRPDIIQNPKRKSYDQPNNLAKEDGRYIYWINGGWQLHIVDAKDPAKLKIVKQLDFKYPDVVLKDIHIYKKYLVVTAESHERTKAFIYDVSNMPKVTKIKEVDISGAYLSAMVKDSHLYLFANDYVDALGYKEIAGRREFVPTPYYSEPTNNKYTQKMELNNINYLPGSLSSNYLVVMGLNLKEPTSEAKIRAFFGAGTNIYVTDGIVYVPVRYSRAPTSKQNQDTVSEHETAIFKFKMDNGELTFANKGLVGGTILANAVNEHNENLTVATIGGAFAETTAGAIDNIYVLDKNMKVIGSIHGIAKKISSRVDNLYIYPHFAGDKIYLDRQMKPLFVIDLKNPQVPEFLGPIETPLSTDRYHYQDKQYISYADKFSETGKANGTKLIMADIRNDKSHKLISEIALGNRGTYSKTLLLDKTRNLLVIAVRATKLDAIKPETTKKPYYKEETIMGDPVFNGAYIYSIDRSKGLQFKGAVTHYTKQDMKSKQTYYSGVFDEMIKNALIKNNVLYIMSPSRVSAHDLSQVKKIASISVKPPLPVPYVRELP